MSDNVGDRFQEETVYRRDAMSDEKRMDPATRPEFLKTYPDAPRLSLSPPETAGGAPMWDAVAARRSLRRYDDRPLRERDLSQLLWATQGVTRRMREMSLRASPSAGALYPIETYIVAHRVEGVEPGLYHYAVDDGALEQLRTGDLRDEVAGAALDQGVAYFSQCVFVWSAVFERSKWKYLQRAYRYVYLDAGHIAQNLALAAVGLGLGTCQIGAIYDEEANAMLGVDGERESVVYMSTVGWPKG